MNDWKSERLIEAACWIRTNVLQFRFQTVSWECKRSCERKNLFWMNGSLSMHIFAIICFDIRFDKPWKCGKFLSKQNSFYNPRFLHRCKFCRSRLRFSQKRGVLGIVPHINPTLRVTLILAITRFQYLGEAAKMWKIPKTNCQQHISF